MLTTCTSVQDAVSFCPQRSAVQGVDPWQLSRGNTEQPKPSFSTSSTATRAGLTAMLSQSESPERSHGAGGRKPTGPGTSTRLQKAGTRRSSARRSERTLPRAGPSTYRLTPVSCSSRARFFHRQARAVLPRGTPRLRKLVTPSYHTSALRAAGRGPGGARALVRPPPPDGAMAEAAAALCKTLLRRQPHAIGRSTAKAYGRGRA